MAYKRGHLPKRVSDHSQGDIDLLFVFDQLGRQPAYLCISVFPQKWIPACWISLTHLTSSYASNMPFSRSTRPSPSAENSLHLHPQISRESEATTAYSVHSGASSTSPILPPPPALPHARRQQQDDALTDFFGGRGQRVRAQQQQPPRPSRQPRAPPPYSPDWDGEKLPVYAPSDSEPDTVARQMFKYGFCTYLLTVFRLYERLTMFSSVSSLLGNRSILPSGTHACHG